MNQRRRRLIRRRATRAGDTMAAYEKLAAEAQRLIRRGRYDEAMRLLLGRTRPGAQTAGL